MVRFGYWFCVIVLILGCTRDPSPVLSPEKQLETFRLAPGLRIELVASEPMVQEPVVISFDPRGRLWVVEMRGFMQDIEGTNEDAPIGRVSVLFDDDADGLMDRSIVFADSLVLPRSIAFVEEGVLIAEDEPLWLYQDLDGDLVADQRQLIDSVYAKKGMVEHAPNGLLRGMDGWLYNAKSDHRYKKVDGVWVKEKTEFRGQWGISKDDVGRLYYNYNWSQLHADLVPPNYLNRNANHTSTTGIDVGLTTNRSVFPIRPNLAANRGYLPETLDEEGKIKEFTSACSPFVYRGGLLPDEYDGNVFVCEPVGNLIKRNVVSQESFNLLAEYAYDSSEFLASTDERFRPVALASGPDGALYISDMYHGIIEHGPYMTEYLREMILERKLESPIHMGRIWRIVPEDFNTRILKDPSEMSSAQLVDLLDSENGWYRDQAQQLLAEGNDRMVFPWLEEKVNDQNTDYTTRIHALWTLYEMGSPDHEVYFRAMNDENAHVQALAVRLLGELVEAGKTEPGRYAQRLMEMSGGRSDIVDLQITLSAGFLENRFRGPILVKLAGKQFDKPLIRDAMLSSLANEELDFMQMLMGDEYWAAEDPNRAIMFEMLASAVTRRADPEEVITLVGSINKFEGTLDWKWQAVLDGMSLYAMEEGLPSVQVREKPSIFSRLTQFDESNQDKIASLTSLFEWPGKEIEQGQDKASKVKVDPEQFAYGRKQYLNVCAGCHGNDGKGMSRFGPPLRNSEWVLGSEKRLALLLIHGMKGPVTVAGKEYDAPDILPEMPSFSVIDDRKLAAIMTYIRTEWGHQAEPVSGGRVAGYRVRGQGKLTPWTAEELMNITEE